MDLYNMQEICEDEAFGKIVATISSANICPLLGRPDLELLKQPFSGTIVRGAQCNWVAQLEIHHDELFHNGNGLGRNCVAQRCGLAYSIRAQRGDIESVATHDSY